MVSLSIVTEDQAEDMDMGADTLMYVVIGGYGSCHFVAFFLASQPSPVKKETRSASASQE